MSRIFLLDSQFYVIFFRFKKKMYTCDIDCVVLGAGQGSRMLDLTGGGAKCLIPVAGHPLLYYSLKILEENGFKSAIVTGIFYMI